MDAKTILSSLKDPPLEDLSVLSPPNWSCHFSIYSDFQKVILKTNTARILKQWRGEMLGFGAKKKRSVENWRRRARWIDLKKTQVIIISPETQSAVDNSKVNIPVDCPQNVPSVIDFPTLHQMETSFSGTSVSFEEIYPMSPGILKGRSFEKEIDVRSLGKNATNKWIIRTLKNLPSKTE